MAVQLPDRPRAAANVLRQRHTGVIILVVRILPVLLLLLLLAPAHRIAALQLPSAMTEASSPSASLAALPPSQEPGLSSPQTGPVRSSSENAASDVAAPKDDPAKERIEKILQSEVCISGVLRVVALVRLTCLIDWRQHSPEPPQTKHCLGAGS